MSEPEIKPRIDDDGVGWCDAGCPQASEELDGIIQCAVLKSPMWLPCEHSNGEVCPIHTARMAALLRECEVRIGYLITIDCDQDFMEEDQETCAITMHNNAVIRLRALLGGE